MSMTHLHLLLNHFPVIGMIMVTLLLAIAFLRKSNELTRVSLWALAGLAGISLIVFLTGEPAEEIIENLPGFSEALTEQHEEFALFATIVVGVAGLISIALLAVERGKQMSRRLITLSLAMSIAGSAAMGYTAWLGGQLRHTEVRSGSLPVPAAEADGD